MFIVLYYPKGLDLGIKKGFGVIGLNLPVKSLKIFVIALERGFIEQLGAAIINLNLMGFLCSFGVQYICGSFLLSSATGRLKVSLSFFESFSMSSLTSQCIDS